MLGLALWPFGAASAADVDEFTVLQQTVSDSAGAAEVSGNGPVNPGPAEADLHDQAPNVVEVVPGGSSTVPIRPYPALTEFRFDREGTPADYVTCFYADRDGNPLPADVLAERGLPEYLVLAVDEVAVPIGHHLVCHLMITLD